MNILQSIAKIVIMSLAIDNIKEPILLYQQNKQYVFNCINALNTGRMGQAHIKTFENVKANIFIVIR